MRLKIYYGGTFDPVHNGHLGIAQAARSTFDSEVWLLPCADPPHRAPAFASASQRAEMLELAIAAHPGLHCDRREHMRPGRSYSVLTLRALRDELGADTPLAWLIGSDAFLGLPSWHEWQELLTLCHFIVVPRPGLALSAASTALAAACVGRWQDVPEALLQAPAGYLYRLSLAPHPESASDIRMGLQTDGNMTAQLPAPVLDYIHRHGLYRSSV